MDLCPYEYELFYSSKGEWVSIGEQILPAQPFVNKFQQEEKYGQITCSESDEESKRYFLNNIMII